MVYAQTSGHGFNPVKIAEGFGSSLAALFSTDNLNATVYSLLSAGLGAYAAVLLFGPHEVSSSCWLALSLVKAYSTGVLTAVSVLFCLFD